MPLSCRVSYFTTDPIPVGRHDCVALMVRVARHNTMRFEPLAMGRSGLEPPASAVIRPERCASKSRRASPRPGVMWFDFGGRKGCWRQGNKPKPALPNRPDGWERQWARLRVSRARHTDGYWYW